MDNFFYKNIAYLRKTRNLNLIQMGKIMGIGKSQVAQYEHGKNEPTLGVVINVIRYFGITFSQLVETDFNKPVEYIVDEPVHVVNEPGEYSRLDQLKELEIENRTLKQALREIGKGINEKEYINSTKQIVT